MTSQFCTGSNIRPTLKRLLKTVKLNHTKAIPSPLRILTLGLVTSAETKEPCKRIGYSASRASENSISQDLFMPVYILNGQVSQPFSRPMYQHPMLPKVQDPENHEVQINSRDLS